MTGIASSLRGPVRRKPARPAGLLGVVAAAAALLGGVAGSPAQAQEPTSTPLLSVPLPDARYKLRLGGAEPLKSLLSPSLKNASLTIGIDHEGPAPTITMSGIAACEGGQGVGFLLTGVPQGTVVTARLHTAGGSPDLKLEFPAPASPLERVIVAACVA